MLVEIPCGVRIPLVRVFKERQVMKLELSQKEIVEAIADWINNNTEYEIKEEDIVLQANNTTAQADVISAVIVVSVA